MSVLYKQALPEILCELSRPLTPETLAVADVVLIPNDRHDVDYGLVADHAKLVVDTRNVMARRAEPKTLVKA